MQLLMALHAHHIKAFEQPVELPLTPANDAIGVLARPLELGLLKWTPLSRQFLHEFKLEPLPQSQLNSAALLLPVRRGLSPPGCTCL